MKKKLTAIALIVALLAVAVIGGTLAYFTDTDEATNTFTVGGVKIDLHESSGTATDAAYQDWLADQVLMPGKPEDTAIAKQIWVENTGKSDAYIRLHIAIPDALDDGADTFNASLNLLHFNADSSSYVEGKWNWGTKLVAGKTGFVGTGNTWNCYQVTVDNVLYNVYVVTYETPVASEAETPLAMTRVYINFDATQEEIEMVNEAIGDEWNILVVAEAGQTDGFIDAFTALNTQFGTPGSYNPFA